MVTGACYPVFPVFRRVQSVAKWLNDYRIPVTFRTEQYCLPWTQLSRCIVCAVALLRSRVVLRMKITVCYLSTNPVFFVTI